ncbi:MAG: altronate dehydratase family protein [Desulfocapsaceae bacterium]|jgi:altronate hydrolase|nr:altronate dehydratase family protein [Desulfocapsaceae bacterium]
MTQKTVLQIDEHDDLVVALQPLDKGESFTINDIKVVLQQNIPAKHKFAGRSFTIGERATMYGITVGEVILPIEQGELITTDNLRHATSEPDTTTLRQHWSPPAPPADLPEGFMGYARSNATAGTANHWIFVPLVFCSNQELLIIKDVLPKVLGITRPTRYESFTEELVRTIQRDEAGAESMSIQSHTISPPTPVFANIDGIKFLTHSLGCGGTRADARLLCGLLADYITHPNVAGATVISLGCQNAEISLLKEEVAKRTAKLDKPLFFFDRQAWDGPGDMTEAMIRQTMIGLQEADKTSRSLVPLSRLTVGVECGGSDGFSGISANPVIGRSVDHFVAAGASAILAEFPELCGVESELVSRCTTQKSADRFLALMSEYRRQAQMFGTDFDMNPSPGNIRDGLITDAMKSAGAAKKGGTAPIVDVLDYPEQVSRPGLSLLCTPGGDVESTTALVGAGANLVLFSTGLGTPTGNAIAPVLKISSNSTIARRLERMIDFDCGPIITGNATIGRLGEQLYKLCLQTAAGQYQAKAVRLGQDDFIPWKREVSL